MVFEHWAPNSLSYSYPHRFGFERSAHSLELTLLSPTRPRFGCLPTPLRFTSPRFHSHPSLSALRFTPSLFSSPYLSALLLQHHKDSTSSFSVFSHSDLFPRYHIDLEYKRPCVSQQQQLVSLPQHIDLSERVFLDSINSGPLSLSLSPTSHHQSSNNRHSQIWSSSGPATRTRSS